MRDVEYFHDHVRIEHLLFDGAPAPVDGALAPDLSRPGLGVEFKRADAERYAGGHLIGAGRGRTLAVDHADVDAGTLERELRAAIRGEVRFDAGSRALYATDASNYRQTPIGVVVPRDAADVVETVAIARRHGAPVLPPGGGTSLAGQCCNAAVIIEMSKYLDRILEVDVAGRRARVEPGCVLDTLRAEAGRHGLTFGPDPSTHTHCTLGGMIGNNSCGVHSVLSEFYGPGPSTAHNLEAMEVLTYDGVRLRVGATGEAELDAIVRAGGRRGQIYGRLRALRDRYAEQIRRRYPDIPRYLRGLRRLFERYGYACALYGHFGQGCVHTRIDFDLVTRPGIAKFRAFLDDASDLVLRLGGSISGEHGDGQSRAELLPKMFGEELMQALREFKAIWDPAGRMNPGKVVDPLGITANLRLGPEYRPTAVRTHFRFPRTGEASRAPPRAAWASASAARPGPAPCARASWSPGRSGIPRAGARICSSRCCAAIRCATAGATSA